MHYTPEDIARAETAGAADIARMFQNNGYNIKYVRNDYWQAIDPRTNRAIGIYADGAYDYYSGEKTHGMISTVMKYFDLRFPDAVASLLNKQLTKSHPITRENEKEKKTELKMPKNIGKPEFVEKYLCEKRKLPNELVKVFEEKELIFASKHDRFTNVCFVGKDYNGTPAFCSWRGTIGDKYRGNSPGSDKRFPFRWQGISDKVYVFESPIDLMSYIALSNNEKWIEDNYVALSGIETSGLEEFLKRNTKIKEVYACLDNDDAGKEGNEKISKLVGDLLPDVKVNILIPNNKDWNEDLVALVKDLSRIPSIREQVNNAEARADAHNKNNISCANLSAEHFKRNEEKDI